jgi:hypothetical protein
MTCHGTVHRNMFYEPEPPSMCKLQIAADLLTINNVPVVFMARYVMVLRGATSLRWALEGVGPENRNFFGPWNGTSEASAIWAQKSRDICRYRYLLAFLLSYRSIFSQVYIHARLLEQFSGSQAAFRTTVRVTCGYQKEGTNFLRRVTRKTFTISKLFQRSKHKHYFWFPSQKDSKKMWKPSALIQKLLFCILEPIKIYFSWHYPFNVLSVSNHITIHIQ